ncbi:MAG: restriction endonuclease subunit S [Alphaproteobacteria bacterium HGW-Alphaproteobacteria-7]|nr:MAG: restriction endonuclease subunit S [Alphaproteobacteria bacterium HGW-Alphaproteobacteria-7]
MGSGATPESGNPDYWDGDIFWVTPEDVSAAKDGKIVGTKRRITDDGLRSCSARLSPPETIVLTKRAPIGQLAVAEVELCSNQGCFLLEPGSGVDPQFYFHWLNANTAYLQILGRGSTFMELSTDDLKSLRVPHPPIHVQNSIAGFLNENAAQIDTLIEAKQKLLGLLAEKRRTLVAEAVMRGLDRSAPLRPSDIDWLGDIPAHWKIERSRWLFNERDERSETGEEEMLTVSHITGVTPRSQKDVNMFEAETTAGYKLCFTGDLVINTLWAWMGAMGTAPVDGIVSPAYNVYTPGQRLLPAYVDALVRIPVFAQEVTRYSKGVWSSRLRLYPEGFFETFWPVPPLDEQEQIVARIAEERVKIDKLATATERSITLLKERRSALIAAAVTGQIAIPEAA